MTLYLLSVMELQRTLHMNRTMLLLLPPSLSLPILSQLPVHLLYVWWGPVIITLGVESVRITHGVQMVSSHRAMLRIQSLVECAVLMVLPSPAPMWCTLEAGLMMLKIFLWDTLSHISLANIRTLRMRLSIPFSPCHNKQRWRIFTCHREMVALIKSRPWRLSRISLDVRQTRHRLSSTNRISWNWKSWRMLPPLCWQKPQLHRTVSWLSRLWVVPSRLLMM